MTNLKMFKWRNKDGEIKKLHLKSIIYHKWRDFGDLVASYQQLEVWSKEKDAKGCCSAVLNHWLNQTSRYPATWNSLYELLEDCELSNIAADLKIAIENAI